MKSHILAIREGIAAKRFVNEASVSQGIVLRILNALSWPTFDVDIVAPEYAVEGRRVDFALCHPRGKPLVFIEVKQIGQSGGADRQLFEYAFHRGVPLAVLTDGQEWHFFLPGEQGDYGERRVYKVDLLERDPDECAERLTRYLNYSGICTGVAIDAARKDYRDVTKERQIQAALPEAWKKLVDDEDELLLELVADKVESICGFKPDPSVVAAFLKQPAQRMPMPVNPVARTPIMKGPIPPGSPANRAIAPTGNGFVLRGKTYMVKSAREVLVRVIKELAATDPAFLDRFDALPKHASKVRYVARSRDALNPGQDRLTKSAREFAPGWWVYQHLGIRDIEQAVKLACEVANIRFGQELSTFFERREVNLPPIVASSEEPSVRGGTTERVTPWRETLGQVIRENWSIGDTFTLNDLYGFKDWFAKEYPKNQDVQSTIRFYLQKLRDDGMIQFLGKSGQYRRIK